MTASEPVVLAGCRRQPLAHYLKAVGAFRVVAEQREQPVRARWQGDALVLIGERLSRQEVEQFFLEGYRPTPIVSPWNKSSGFDGKSIPELEAILEADEPRLEAYQSAIRAARQLVEAAAGEDLTKEELLLRCRAWLPDEALAWLDAAVVLTEGGAAFPPLLGTGGNLGRMELSRNYMGHVARILGFAPGRKAPTGHDAEIWLRASLFDEGTPALVSASIAQYDPGPAGGADMAPEGKAESVVNPWDFVLVMEGALLFASAAARRMGSDAGGTASMPFTTSESRVGYASSASSEPAKGELWAPIWHRALSLPELARLMAEGRAEWQGRQARTGLDFVRAVASLGTDRGIEHFVRHAFVERLGQMSLAVPVGVVAVKERPEVRVLGQLDRWLGRLHRVGNPPSGVATALRAVDGAMYDSATNAGAGHLHRVLRAVAVLHRAVERSRAVRERIGPLSDLVADQWLPELDDHTDEFAVALTLASAKDRDGWGLRALLSPVREDRRGYLRWTDRSAPVAGLGVRPVQEVLTDALQRHALSRSSAERTPEPAEEFDHVGHGLDLAFMYQRSAPLRPVMRAARGQLDGQRISELLDALLLLNWRPREGVGQHQATPVGPRVLVPPHAALVLPCFHGRGITFRRRRVLLRAGPAWPRLLATNKVEEVAREAALRLRMAGLPAPVEQPLRDRAEPLGPWLAVAALCRLPHSGGVRLLENAVPDDVETRE